MKKILSCLISIMIIMAMFTMNVHSALPGALSPMWDVLSTIEINVNFVGGDGTAIANITGVYGYTNQIDAIMIVYQEVDGELIYIDSTGGSAETALRLRVDFDAESGATYVAEVIVTAYSSEGSETETISDTNTCP